MEIRKGRKFYLKDGKLDLSILDESIDRDTDKVIIKEEYNNILEDIESMDLSDKDISATLEEMAMIFGIQDSPSEDMTDEFTKAFNEERLQKEMKEFGIKND